MNWKLVADEARKAPTPNWPLIATQVMALVARIDELETALIIYGFHLDECPAKQRGFNCTCGLDEVKRK